MTNLVDKINAKHVRKDIPEFRVGDTVRVNVWVIEGNKKRIQSFEGLVTDINGGSVSKRFSVRKKSYAQVTSLKRSLAFWHLLTFDFLLFLLGNNQSL